ncbi:hypothetical protein BH09PLA1_BH09PLA1_12680 [soil metagenome]
MASVPISARRPPGAPGAPAPGLTAPGLTPPGATAPGAPAPHPVVAPAPTSESDPIVPPPLGFWQQPRTVDIVSFASSLALHLAVLIFGFLGYRTYQQIATQSPVEQPIIPDAAMIEGAPVGGIPNPGLGGDPERAAAQDQVKDMSAANDSWKQRRGDTLTQSLMGDTAGDGAADSIIAPGLRSGLALGKGPGAGAGDGNAQAPFGVPGGGAGQGPKANFIGISGNARTVAYVCDSSGSMMNMMFALKAELRKAIDPLRPVQAFNVIFFADKEKPQALNPKGELVMANADNKRKAYEFLNSITTAGATNPLPGLENAFRGKPQLIYLLTDGNFPDNNAVLNKIRELNAQKKTKINTILFCDASSIEKGIVELLKQVADENGGVFKVVDTKDF